MAQNFNQWLDSPPPHRPPANKVCDHQGCSESGEFRAPKSRQQIVSSNNEWYWFCLNHVRAYNASWDYYKGMTEPQIVREHYDDITWQRPTWPLGADKETASHPWRKKFQDPFGLFNDTTPTDKTPPKVVDRDEIKALNLFSLGVPFTKDNLQKAYRLLVKKYHPDCNKDNPNAEEMIRQINQAYALLQKMCS